MDLCTFQSVIWLCCYYVELSSDNNMVIALWPSKMFPLRNRHKILGIKVQFMKRDIWRHVTKNHDSLLTCIIKKIQFVFVVTKKPIVFIFEILPTLPHNVPPTQNRICIKEERFSDTYCHLIPLWRLRLSSEETFSSTIWKLQFKSIVVWRRLPKFPGNAKQKKYSLIGLQFAKVWLFWEFFWGSSDLVLG